MKKAAAVRSSGTKYPGTAAKAKFWRLEKPPDGDAVVNDRLKKSFNSLGPYFLTDQGQFWRVERRGAVVPLIKQLGMTITSGKIISGSVREIDSEVARWRTMTKALESTDDVEADRAATHLEGLAPTSAALDFATAKRAAQYSLLLAPADRLGEFAVRVETALERWFPGAQMVVWAKNFDYQAQYRPIHLLAAASLVGIGEVAEGLTQDGGKGGSWFSGEDLFTQSYGSIYNDLLAAGTTGISLETPVFTFVFEFGRLTSFGFPLDIIAAHELHSYSNLNHLPREFATARRVAKPGNLEQPRVRSWFVSGINRLADYLLRWENFRTKSGELRPLTQQQVAMTAVRILNTTAHLLAVRERTARLADFWALIDLYASFLNDDREAVLGAEVWSGSVLSAAASMPGRLGPMMLSEARVLRRRWVRQCASGIVQGTRRTSRSVVVGKSGSEVKVPLDAFFAKHFSVRRNTLHGYALHDEQKYRDYLAIHDGTIPYDVEEWGRFMLYALLANPDDFLNRYRRLK